MKNIFNYNKFLILEKHLTQVNFREVATKTYIDTQDSRDFLNAYAIDYAYEETREILDPDDDLSDITSSEDFKKWLIYELEIKFEKLYYDIFEDLIDLDGYVILYRSMMVDDNYLNKLQNGEIRRIGRYWSYEFEGAEPHHGYNSEDKQNEIVFETKIKEEFIDWIETFRLNLEHSYYNEEKEIRLFKNTPLNITTILWNGTKIQDANLLKLNIKS